MTTTILGANGKIGAMLSKHARAMGVGWRTCARTAPADIIWSGRFDDPNIDTVFERGGTLINMIGYTGPNEDQLHQSNVRLVQDLLAKAAQNGVAHVILASSAAVYGAPPTDKADCLEDGPLHPVSPYGHSKLAMEKAALTLPAGKQSPALSILRIGNVAGADALTRIARRHVQAGTPMPVHRFADGSASLRNYIGPRDLFCAIRDLAAPFDGPPRVLNVIHPQTVTLDAVVQAYRDHVMPALIWEDVDAPNDVIQRVTLSADKVQHFVNFNEYDVYADELGRQLAELLTL